MSFSLNDAEKKFLLELARKTIVNYFHNDNPLKVDYFSDKLKEKCGVFVTLEKHHNLRAMWKVISRCRMRCRIMQFPLHSGIPVSPH